METRKFAAGMFGSALAGAMLATFALGGAAAPGNAPTALTAAAATPVTVSTAAELTAALKAATPGTVITLRDGVYTGKFVGAASGTETEPITLTGTRNAVLSTGTTTSGFALRLTGSFWNVTGISVSQAMKGIMLDGSDNTVIDGVDVGFTGDEAVHLRAGSSNVIVRNSLIHDAGVERPEYGEGIYIGSAKSNWSSPTTPDQSDGAQIVNNTIWNTAGEGIDVKEGTVGGVITGNHFMNAGNSGANFADSWIDVKGNGYEVTGNTGATALLDAFQVHVVAEGWGQNNVFRGNLLGGAVPGLEVSVQTGALGTVVGCAETVAAAGLSNIPCTP